MPNLSWNEIHTRATLFARDWSSATREQADKQTFWNEFFEIFGISRKLVASFEVPVQRLRGTYGFIDLLWNGKVLIEHKSAGASLEAAEVQAFDYIQDLQTVGRGDDIPPYILLSDFRRFALYDLEPDEQLDLPLFRTRRFQRFEFALAELPDNIRRFAFIPGYKTPTFKPQDPLNLKAVNIMAGVHDTLKAGGYSGHDLERFLVRILFCLFAEDTHIFEPESFRLYIENRTHPDGSDLGARLAELFATLDCAPERRQRNLDDDLKAFPYINGALFSERLQFAAFNGPMRKAVLEAANFNWSRISPAIFGALFQEVMNDKERRKIGAHYTSERDILKVIHPLFLDKLRAEFDAIKDDRSGRRASRLEAFRVRLTQLKFLDPACGCGNFLVIAYRELRTLELEVLREQHGQQQALTLNEVNLLSQVDVHQFYGIEIDEWPARIAEVALWLMDHQSNLRILEAFSQPFLRLPLKNSPHIHIGNALRIDWNDLLPANQCSYILGNPPFIGKKEQSRAQKSDVLHTFEGVKAAGILDYVCCWYRVSLAYMKDSPTIECAFVSTSSITQGEQVGVLFGVLLKEGLSINFAHRTFEWMSEARGKAHVHCVIIGFSLEKSQPKVIYDYVADEEHPQVVAAANINPYLVDGLNLVLSKRSASLNAKLPVSYGSFALDDGFLTINAGERQEILSEDPTAAKFIREFVGGQELLYGEKRWCLWLNDASPNEINRSQPILRRVKAVREWRLTSERPTTKALSAMPARFAEIRQPTTRYLALPTLSSERRTYIPIAFMSPRVIASNQLYVFADATAVDMGILSSSMHMAWIKAVCGRLESRYRYSAALVYNNYPWPQNPTPAQKAKVEELAQAVLDARALYPESTLAQLYDPLLMPAELVHAHQRLDRAVERCYRAQPFASDRERVEFLFALYEQLTAPLLPATPVPRRRVAHV